jgi:glutaredoxin
MKIAILDGCNKCENYLNKLEEANIVYEEIDCNDDTNCKKCDELESISSCDMYPMTIIDNNTIFCLSNDFEKLGKLHNVNNKYNVVYCHSIDNMLSIVKKFLNL